MARASTQHKLDRVRPPRVHITYDVEIGDAIEIKELPFQVGVLGDFTGMPTQPLPRVRERKFVEVNPDNFDAVLEGMHPHLAFSVNNRLSDNPDAGQLRIDLHFRTMEDFDPLNVASQVRPLKEMIDLRVKLTDLLGKLQGNDRLDEVLSDILSNPEKLQRLRAEVRPQLTAAIVDTSEATAAAAPAVNERAPEGAAAPAASEAEVQVQPAAETETGEEERSAPSEMSGESQVIEADTAASETAEGESLADSRASEGTDDVEARRADASEETEPARAAETEPDTPHE